MDPVSVEEFEHALAACGVTPDSLSRTAAARLVEEGLHADWGPRGEGEPARVVTSLWMLDDFTRENGATRIVPGSHVLPDGPPKRWKQPGHSHPDQRIVLGRAGAVLAFDGHLWHAGRTNQSSGSRRAMQVSFVAREERGTALLEHPDPTRLSPAGLVLLGLN